MKVSFTIRRQNALRRDASVVRRFMIKGQKDSLNWACSRQEQAEIGGRLGTVLSDLGELPILAAERADGASLEPPRDAAKVESVAARPPGNVAS